MIPNSKRAHLNLLYTELVQNAVTVPDESTNKLCQAAKKVEIHVVIGMHERNLEASNSTLCNIILFIDAQGNIIDDSNPKIAIKIIVDIEKLCF